MASDPQTWAELKTAVADWLDDTTLTTQIPQFIAFAERRFNRILLTPEREVVTTLAMSGETKALPTDLWMVRNLFIDVDPRVVLEQVSLQMLRSAYSSKTTGQPRAYAISGSTLYLGHAPDTTDNLVLDYYQTIPALGASQATNWLLTAHPDVYLYGSLLQAEAFLSNDERLVVWKRALDEGMAEIMAAGHRKRYGGAPVRLRSPVMWNC